MIKKILTTLALSTVLMMSMGPVVTLTYAETTVQHSTQQSMLIAAVDTEKPEVTDSGTKPKEDPKLSESLKKALDDAVVLIIFILKGLYALLMPILALIGFFLSNNWVTGASLGIDGLIEVVWQIVRNIVNIGIVLYLLYLAGANIIPFGDQGKTNIKEQLPKVLVALIVVNFSLLFCRTVLTIGNIATSVAFSIPSSVDALVSNDNNGQAQFFIYDNPYTKNDTNIKACATGATLSSDGNCIKEGVSMGPPKGIPAGTDTRVMDCFHKNYYFRFTDPVASGNDSQSIIANPTLTSDGKFEPGANQNTRVIIQVNAGQTKQEQQEQIRQARESILAGIRSGQTNNYYSDCITSFKDVTFSAQNAMYVYAFNLMRIPSYELAFADATSLTKLGVSMLVAIVLLFMFMLVNVALLVAVVVRAFLLWIMMALSPLWVYTEIMKVWNNDDENAQAFIGGFGRFFNLAMMPAYIGLVLSFGFIIYQFLLVYGAASTGTGGVTHIPLGSLNFYFSANENIIGGLGSIWGLMFPILALIALWAAVFAAVKYGFQDNAVFRKVVKPIQDFGASAGKFVGSVPFNAPIVPLPGGRGRASLNSIREVPGAMQRKWQNAMESEKRKQVDTMIGSDSVANEFSLQLTQVNNTKSSAANFNNQAMKNFLEHNVKHDGVNKALQQILVDIHNSTGGLSHAARNDVYVDHYGSKYKAVDKGHQNMAASQLIKHKATFDDLVKKIKSGEKLTPLDHTNMAMLGGNLFNQSAGSTVSNAGIDSSNKLKITYADRTTKQADFSPVIGSGKSYKPGTPQASTLATQLQSLGVSSSDILAALSSADKGKKVIYDDGKTTPPQEKTIEQLIQEIIK